MVKIKRKVIQIANSTQLISLPRKWSLKYGIKKGEELEVEENGNKLLIGTEKSASMENLEINPPHLKNITERFVTASYRNGFKEVRINFEKELNPGLLEYIHQKMGDQTIGYEMIKQEKNYCIIKDLSGSSNAEFDTALRRSFLLVTTMAKDIFEGLKKNDTEELKNMYYRDRSINKFTNYCAREMILRGYKDHTKTIIYYHFIRNLEAMADQYSLMAVYYSANSGKLRNEFFDALQKNNETLFGYYELFYNFDKAKLNELFSKIKAFNPKDLYKVKKINLVMISYLDSIHRRLKELVDNLIELNLEPK